MNVITLSENFKIQGNIGSFNDKTLDQKEVPKEVDVAFSLERDLNKYKELDISNNVFLDALRSGLRKI